MNRIFKLFIPSKTRSPHVSKKEKICELKLRSSVDKLSFVENMMLAKASENLEENEYEKALFYFEQVLGARKFLYGPGHELVGETHEDIAKALKMLGRNDEAEFHLYAARNDTPSLGGSTQSTATDKEEFDEINYLELSEKTLDLEKEDNQTQDDELLSENEKLLSKLQDSLGAREVLYGPGHKLVKELQMQIAHTLCVMGRTSEAAKYYEAEGKTEEKLTLLPKESLSKGKVLKRSVEVISSKAIQEKCMVRRSVSFSLRKSDPVSKSTLQLCFEPDDNSDNLSKQGEEKFMSTEVFDRPGIGSRSEKKIVTTSLISLIKNEYNPC